MASTLGAWLGSRQPSCTAGVGTILRKLTILATLGQTVVWWSSWTLDVAHTNVRVLGALKETKRIIGGSQGDPQGSLRRSCVSRS